jgi:MFS family permease
MVRPNKRHILKHLHIIMRTSAQHLQVLKNPSYRWFLSNSLLATLGNGLSYIALTWVVVQVHTSPSSVAMLMICFWISMVVFSPIFGVISDKFHRLNLMLISVLARAVILIACGWYLRYHDELWVIYLVSLTNGLAFSLYSPAMLTFLREIVAKENLLYANTQLDITYEIGNVVGMGMAGFVMAIFSPSTALILNGCFFLVSAFFLTRVRYQPKQEEVLSRSLKTLSQDFILGLRYLADRPGLRAVYTLQLLLFVQFMMWPVLLAPFAQRVLHATVIQFGQIEASFSLGVVLGGLLNAALVKKVGFYRLLLIEAIAGVTAFYFFAASDGIWIAGMLCFVIGYAMSAWALIVTKAQEMTELSYQGRMQGTFSSLLGLITVSLYSGVYWLADAAPLQKLYWAEVFVSGLMLLLLVRNRKRFISD